MSSLSGQGGDELILAIDAGTQSMRAALVDPGGGIHHLVKTPIEPYFSRQPGWAEQEPDYYWRVLCDTCRRVMDAAGTGRERVTAAAITTQRLTMVNVDRDGRPLRSAIVWMDQRKADAGKVLPAAAIPALKAIGLYPFVRFVTRYCRSNWIRQHQPDIWARTHQFLFLSGYLTHRLTGEFRDSAGNVIGTIPFDVKRSG